MLVWRGWCLVHLATLGISSNTLNVWGNGVRLSVRVGVRRVCWNKIICIKSHLNASVNDSASTGAHHSVQIFNLFRNHRHKYEWTNMRGWEGNFGRTSHQYSLWRSLCVSVYFHCTLLSLAFVNLRSHSRSGCSVSRARRWVLDPRWILCLVCGHDHHSPNDAYLTQSLTLKGKYFAKDVTARLERNELTIGLFTPLCSLMLRI